MAIGGGSPVELHRDFDRVDRRHLVERKLCDQSAACVASRPELLERTFDNALDQGYCREKRELGVFR
jgi:hypothetical protein